MARLLRRITQRVCCAYRTVSSVAASIISGTPPLEFQARRLTVMYYRNRAAIEDREEISPRTRLHWLLEAKDQALQDWRLSLLAMKDSDPSLRLRDALVSRLGDRVNRKHGWITYHMTQFLTGHGCFNVFLYKIKKSATPECYECTNELDTAQHNLQFCKAWSVERGDLKRIVGNNLDLPSVIDSILDNLDN
nr:PREDICTED: uncharacterized protein LOC105669043 [Linepithema humile]